MPVSRGKRIVDARPQAVEVGVGSHPLTSATGAADEDSASPQRTARRVTVAAVESVPPVGDSAVSPAVPQRFTVPAAVLQRMRQQHHHPVHPQPLSPSYAPPAGAAAAPPQPPLPTEEEEGQHSSTPHEEAKAGHRPSAGDGADGVSAHSAKEAAAVEKVSKADVASSVAALKAVSAHHHEVMPSSPASPDAPPSPSTLAATAESSESGAVAAAAAASKAKPVIFSRRWRQQLFSHSGSTLPLALAAPRTARHGSGADAQNNDGSDTGDEEDEEDDDDGALPFGKASVIKFKSSSADAIRPFGGPPSTLDGRNGSSSSSSSEEEDSPSEGEGEEGELTAGRGDEWQTRRERHAQRQRAQATREHRRVKKHMSGFDKEFLRQQEAQLLGKEEEEEESDNDKDDDEAEGSSEEEEGEEEEAVEESDSPYSDASTAEGSDSAAMSDEEAAVESEVSGGDEEEEEEEESRERGSAGTTVPEKASGSGGFGAMSRARQQEAQARQARAPQHQGESKAPAAHASPSPPAPEVDKASAHAGLPASIGARSHWFDTFFFAVHESRVLKGGCHHTLIGLRGPVSIRGPCGLIGFGIGEVCVDGFYLGKKQMNLWHEGHRAVLTPMKKLKTKHAQDMELPQWPTVPNPPWPPQPTTRAAAPLWCGSPLNPSDYRHGGPLAPSSSLSTAGAGGGAAAEGVDEEALLQGLQWNCEAVFGEVDWDWVEATVQSWRGLFSNKMPPILLVVQPSSSTPRPRGAPGPMRKFYLSRKRNRGGRGRQHGSAAAGTRASDAYMDIPAFVAAGMQTSVDLALLPDVVPAIAAMGCGAVMVLGSANIGKSTLCRFLANVLLSQHGLCYWLDLDVGQPEFGVPGQLTLTLLRRPLLRERDAGCGHTVSSLFLGTTTVAQCPLSAATALATVCAQAARIARDHPVVVNTHGWVLQTGRRVSVEALRRLRPRHVIHLRKASEEAWVEDTAALLDPRNGLNAEVVQRRFLVRHGCEPAQRETQDRAKKGGAEATAGSCTQATSLLCRLPYPQAPVEDTAAAANNSSSSSKNKKNASPVPSGARQHKGGAEASAAEWRGQVHAVCVTREETYSSIQLLKATKGSRGRQQRWQDYFAPLLRFYGEQRGSQRSQKKPAGSGDGEAETTLLEAPLSALRSIVLTERDEKAGSVALFAGAAAEHASAAAAQLHAEVAASLEHAVVAVLFHRPAPSSASSSSASAGPVAGRCVVRSLASLSDGFPVSCYGVVESCEEEILHGRSASQGEGPATAAAASAAALSSEGWIRLRLPLPPSTVAAMLQSVNGTAAAADSTAEQRKPPQKAKASSAAAAARTEESVSVQISIAYSAGLRQDTSFVSAMMEHVSSGNVDTSAPPN